MKYKRMLMILCAILCAVICVSCGKELPKGLNYEIENLPVLSELSGERYEFYDYQFSPVASAVYRCGETEIQIDRQDPRLLRLLNFLACSESRFKSSWSSDYLPEEELRGYYNSTEPMLEVVFNNEGSAEWDKLSSACRMVICGDSFVAFYGDSEAWDISGTLYGKRSWPYAKLVSAQAPDQAESLLSSQAWGSGHWIDLLTFAGISE